MWKTNIAPSKSCYRTTYVPVESGVPQVSVLDPSIFIYIIHVYCDHDIPVSFRNATILYLQMISLHTCTGNNPVVELGYKIHYRCRTTCMISTILQYGKEMADIIANNIFHKKATVKACQPSRPKSCWNGPMMVIF
jgi:hypothetical protein